MSEADQRLVIEGINDAGNRFRPSDWPERISAMFASFGRDHRLHYASSLHPSVVGGAKCLVVEPALKDENRALYEYVLQFARINGLRMHEEPNPAR